MKMNNLAGKILGNRYLLLEKIGDGGMALVYKAKCQLLNRYVAVKILRPEFTTDEEFIKKFKRESMAAASLSHPNIVGIYDVGEEDGIYYIVMEYVHGKTLKEYIRDKGRLDYKETLEISYKIALALEHAHKNGVVHRDIKPHNILITEDKLVKVTDFGIARASTSSTMTNTGKIMGSVHYFSPEQARGGFSDHRTDLYSLGVVMYEMLTGKLPYEADSPISIAIKHIQDTLVEPSRMNSDIPDAVNDIVVKAMEKDMTKRYQSARDIINDILAAQRNPNQTLTTAANDDDGYTKIIPVEDIGRVLENKDRKSYKRKRIWKVLILLVSLFILGTLLYFAYKTYFVVNETQVPKIVGLKQEEAQKILRDYKLAMQVVDSQPSEMEEGRVLRVIPDEGSSIKENETVKVILSSGPKKVTVPNLVKSDIIEAEYRLQSAGLKLGSVERRKSNDVAKGLIIDQEPKPDTQVIEGSEVNIIVSDGPEIKYVRVPLLIGKTLEQAKKELENSNLVLGNIEYGQDTKYIDGVIIDQSIMANKEVSEGTRVDVKVNSNKVQQNEENNKENNNESNKENVEDQLPNQSPNKP